MSRLLEIEAFVHVVAEGSFTRAATQLGVTTSYTSERITGLLVGATAPR